MIGGKGQLRSSTRRKVSSKFVFFQTCNHSVISRFYKDIFFLGGGKKAKIKLKENLLPKKKKNILLNEKLDFCFTFLLTNDNYLQTFVNIGLHINNLKK